MACRSTEYAAPAALTEKETTASTLSLPAALANRKASGGADHVCVTCEKPGIHRSVKQTSGSPTLISIQVDVDL